MAEDSLPTPPVSAGTTTSMSTSTTTNGDTMKRSEEWIFTLYLPFANQKFIQLITSHESTDSTIRRVDSNVRVGGVGDNTSDDETATPETKSLLDNDDNNDLTDGAIATTISSNCCCCWKFESPMKSLFQSNVLLKLSYRPAWQGIPEYTRAQRQRTLSKTLGCCYCNDNLDTEQIWEVYTTQDIVKTTRKLITIRGMGNCQAIQVYLKSMTDDNAETTDSMNPPSAFDAALKVHKERKGTGTSSHQNYPQTSSSNRSRFSQSDDSLPPLQDYNYIVVTFAVPVETEIAYDPPLLWKVDIPRPQRCDIMLDTITVLDGIVDLKEPASHAYIQGYQSWSFTGSIYQGQPQPQPALPNMFSRAFNFGGSPPDTPTLVVPIPSKQQQLNGTAEQIIATTQQQQQKLRNKKKKKPTYQSDFFTCLTTGRDEALDEVGGPAFICGWLSQHQQYGVITLDDNLKHLEMHASHHAQVVSDTVTTDWAYGQVVAPHYYDEEPMVHYLHAVAAYNEAKPLQNGPLLTGWCSWYHYYENITQEILRGNFARLATMKQKVPTNVAVVDDGYMTAWGDWDSLKPKKFTDMKAVSQDIKSHAMRSGLWLAPFACDKHSKIVHTHPEWIIQNDQGRPANSSNCGKFFYGLDATNPQVRAHAFHAVRRAVHDWGFKVLKLDFLYAACLEGNGKYDISMTRAQTMHLALQTIREAAGPDVFIIGCGCPIGPGVGYVDGMRISADTGPTWYPAFPLPWWDHSTLPSLRAMIRNSMSRSPMGHRWWHNDPDCLLLGETTSLTNDEVASAASIIAMTCGMMLLSDDLTKVSIPRMRILTKIFPMTGVSAVVLDLHIAKDRGIPSIMRLWCTDRYNSLAAFRQSESHERGIRDANYNAEATHFGRQASFDLSNPTVHPNERKRSCIHVAKGLGTWTVISLSNWADQPTVMDIPTSAVHSPPETGWDSNDNSNKNNNNNACSTNQQAESGYHVFSFWSGRYCWVSLRDEEEATHGGIRNNNHNNHNYGPLHRTLAAHETEIFHIRPVTPSIPQYIGSDLHFSCGYEILSFDATSESHKVSIRLKTELNRVGHVYLYVPTVNTNLVQVGVNGKAGRWSHVGSTPREGGPSHCCGIILRIMVVVHADGSDKDGEIVVTY